MQSKLFKSFNTMLIFGSIMFSACTSSTTRKGEVSDLKSFNISFEESPNGIKMTCEKGCAWEELTISLNENKPQAINAQGMTELDKKTRTKEANLADFLFTIVKTNEEVKLTGIEGTAWEELTFSILKGHTQMLNENGITVKNK